tara:strand:- start:3369 stop:3668 length:300 start_codon:yes stop_codon:yes gene_type:complete
MSHLKSLCSRHFETTDIEAISNMWLGMLFLSHCSKDMDEDSDEFKQIERFIDDTELERQESLVYDQSESTNPHTPMYEGQEETPQWVWELIYGYKPRKS